jgi:hypothetical protein
MAELQTYSVLLAWHDNDPEQGEFGCYVRATGYEDAEAKAREKMRQAYAEQYDIEMDGNGGRVIDCSEGAAWLASDLESALRALVETCKAQWPDLPDVQQAETVLARIEAEV